LAASAGPAALLVEADPVDEHRRGNFVLAFGGPGQPPTARSRMMWNGLPLKTHVDPLVRDLGVAVTHGTPSIVQVILLGRHVIP